MRILLVEDDLSLVQALQQSLQREGFIFNHVNRGLLALVSLATPDHDMVILDLGLPDIDGTDILKRLRANRAIKKR